MKNSNNLEGNFAIVTAIFVLFSAMLNPWISVMISVIVLISFALWRLRNKK